MMPHLPPVLPSFPSAKPTDAGDALCACPQAGLAPLHTPVLCAPMLEALFAPLAQDAPALAPLPQVPERHNPQPCNLRILDGTFGAGGYSRAILDYDCSGTRHTDTQALPVTAVLALDRDPSAAALARALELRYGARFCFSQSRFSSLAEIVEANMFLPLHAIVLDIGVSSMQLDAAERGFSFRFEGPLDMRMGGAVDKDAPSARDLVNGAREETLADIFYHYGEERHARKIARAIIKARALASFDTTTQLAHFIARLVPGPPCAIHPATRAFQALRIAVNAELEELLCALKAAEAMLAPGGRLVVVTFHSLEDRIVKKFLKSRADGRRLHSRLLPGETPRDAPQFFLPRGYPKIADAAEIANNPRARSAKLRLAVRTGAPAAVTQADEDLLPLGGFCLADACKASIGMQA